LCPRRSLVAPQSSVGLLVLRPAALVPPWRLLPDSPPFCRFARVFPLFLPGCASTPGSPLRLSGARPSSLLTRSCCGTAPARRPCSPAESAPARWLRVLPACSVLRVRAAAPFPPPPHPCLRASSAVAFALGARVSARSLVASLLRPSLPADAPLCIELCSSPARLGGRAGALFQRALRSCWPPVLVRSFRLRCPAACRPPPPGRAAFRCVRPLSQRAGVLVRAPPSYWVGMLTTPVSGPLRLARGAWAFVPVAVGFSLFLPFCLAAFLRSCPPAPPPCPLPVSAPPVFGLLAVSAVLACLLCLGAAPFFFGLSTCFPLFPAVCWFPRRPALSMFQGLSASSPHLFLPSVLFFPSFLVSWFPAWCARPG